MRKEQQTNSHIQDALSLGNANTTTNNNYPIFPNHRKPPQASCALTVVQSAACVGHARASGAAKASASSTSSNGAGVAILSLTPYEQQD